MLQAKCWKKTEDPSAKLISALTTKVEELQSKLAFNTSLQANATNQSGKQKLHIPAWRTIINGDKLKKMMPLGGGVHITSVKVCSMAFICHTSHLSTMNGQNKRKKRKKNEKQHRILNRSQSLPQNSNSQNQCVKN